MNAFKTQARDDLIRNADLSLKAADSAHKDVMMARKEFREEMKGLMGGNYMAQGSGKTD